MAVRVGSTVDGFALAYDDVGEGPPVVVLHGWPGDRHDHRDVLARLAGRCRAVAADLRGFGETRGADPDPVAYAADGQARSVVALVDELALGPVVLAGYDVGSRVAQAVAAARPDLVRALVVSPPLPGAGDRVLAPGAQREFWYQSFHQLALAERLVHGPGVRAYLAHFWSHWSGPAFLPDEAELDRLAALYARPGRFADSIGWYRAGAGMVARSLAERAPEPADRIAVPTTVLWPEHDPLFPRAWGDRLGEWFADVEVRNLDGVGHFVPLEAPDAVAAAVLGGIRGSAVTGSD
ncbi:MAG: alpha/beta fold hydrolase [Pseudonocardia sp.]